MRKIFIDATLALFLVLIFSSGIASQTSGRSSYVKAGKTDPRDLSGVWNRAQHGKYYSTKEPPPLLPWAEEKFKAAEPGDVDSDPTMRCYMPGVPRVMFSGEPEEIINTPGRVIMLFERDHIVRQIYTDGRGHPADLNPSYMGDSIGRWDADTLVIDTIGFNDKTWLDTKGLPHTKDLHVVERLRRIDHDTLEYTFTINDPGAYAKPWTGQTLFKLEPNWNITEYSCADNFDWDKKESSK